ncbi:MAG: hypothetical protein OEZ39_14160 [Gammaproteobacteria bacterium]|nr:hypothetical protein [Gammaproteobacteria bacterium]MDH5652996.1 hypothetical protein [Gammaproteobacteria bacterium]
MQDNQTVSKPLGEAISNYTRTQAINDGLLIDVSDTARKAGFCWPVAMTSRAWADCVAWTAADNHRKTWQDENCRLWEVLVMAYKAIQCSPDKPQIKYNLERIPRFSRNSVARLTTLKVVSESSDDGKSVVTIMLPQEDSL